MSYIDNWFHFYSTTESFEVHRKQGLINPDSICFLKETGQIYTQNSFFGICRERYEKLEQLVLDHDAKIKDILGIEGPSIKDGIVNNIADLVNFLDGFTDEDNLKDFLDAMRTALENQISAVNKALSDRITALEDEIHNDSESLHNAINAINSQIETIDIRLDNHDTAISALNTSLASHIREYNLLKTNYENFKAYAETKFTAIDSSISSINISIATLQQEFTNLDEKFDDVENEVSEVKALLEDAKLLVRELEDRFGETLAAIEQFKKDVNDEIDDFKALVGAPNGMAPLDGDAKVPAAYLPSYVDDVLEYATRAAFPVTGETGKIYVSLDDNLTYRWSGSTYIEISKSLGLGETATTAYPGNKGKKNADDIAAHKADTNNPHNVTKTQLGLDKVNNTSDADKPVSTAQAAAIKVVQDDLTSHKGNKANPHEVTKAQVGLSNVDNTSDLDKPISKATQAALDVLDTSLDTHIADKTNPHNVTKEQLGLGNVENTADKDKPISDATQNVLDTKVDKIVGKGLSTNDFTNEDKAKLDRATTVNDEGKISAELIPVDEEDLTVHSITDTNKVIRLKDRDTANGMGYKILRLSEELDNILTQDMINESNTIYEIRYDFDLAGDTITIPENCVLKFEGGKLSNGNIVLSSNSSIVDGVLELFALTCNGNNTIENSRFDGGNNSHGIKIYGDNVFIRNSSILNIKAPNAVQTTGVCIGDYYKYKDGLTYSNIEISNCVFRGCEPYSLEIAEADSDNKYVARMIMSWCGRNLAIRECFFAGMYGSVDSDIIMVYGDLIEDTNIPFTAEAINDGANPPFKGTKYSRANVIIQNNTFLQESCKSSAKILASDVEISGNSFIVKEGSYRDSSDIFRGYAVVRAYNNERLNVSNNSITVEDDVYIYRCIQLYLCKDAVIKGNTIATSSDNLNVIIDSSYSIASVTENVITTRKSPILYDEYNFNLEFTNNNVHSNIISDSNIDFLYRYPTHYMYPTNAGHLLRIQNNVLTYNFNGDNLELSFYSVSNCKIIISDNTISTKGAVSQYNILYGDTSIPKEFIFTSNNVEGAGFSIEGATLKLCKFISNKSLARISLNNAEDVEISNNEFIKNTSNYVIRFNSCDKASISNNMLDVGNVTLRVEGKTMPVEFHNNILSTFSTYFPNDGGISGGSYIPSNSPVLNLDRGSLANLALLQEEFNTPVGHIFMVDSTYPYIKKNTSYVSLNNEWKIIR